MDSSHCRLMTLSLPLLLTWQWQWSRPRQSRLLRLRALSRQRALPRHLTPSTVPSRRLCLARLRPVSPRRRRPRR